MIAEAPKNKAVLIWRKTSYRYTCTCKPQFDFEILIVWEWVIWARVYN